MKTLSKNQKWAVGGLIAIATVITSVKVILASITPVSDQLQAPAEIRALKVEHADTVKRVASNEGELEYLQRILDRVSQTDERQQTWQEEQRYYPNQQYQYQPPQYESPLPRGCWEQGYEYNCETGVWL